ncbi:MAG: lysine--tRNA ligase, partial [Planctomycetaceae bacterium]
MTEPDRLELARIEKLEKIIALGHDPWGERFDNHMAIEKARELAPPEYGTDGSEVRVAGRIMGRNDRGKLKFMHVQDMTGRIQIMVSKADVSEELWALIENWDLGDLVGIDGPLRRTRTGEITVFVKQAKILCKSLAQPPEKYHGAKDLEMLLRQRYLDLIYNPHVLQRMIKRTHIIDSIRQTLREQNFLEVETPVLHAIAGGAAARPFITSHNALGIPLYLRIALELHLKRLMVGGIERVYEMSRVFRNEGVDATHNPEFTMIELYQAYGNYETMMELTEQLLSQACLAANGTTVVKWGEEEIDFTPPYPRRKYADLFREYAGCDPGDTEAVKEIARKHGLKTDNVHPDVMANEVFELMVEDKLTGPIFVIDYP